MNFLAADQPLKSVLFIYATETGNAEEIAYSLCETCKVKYDIAATTLDIADLTVQSLQQRDNNNIVVFVVSTTGDGDAPRSMKSFWTSLLRKGLTNSTLSCRYAVFGLGDSSYEKFNVVGRKLFVRMQQIGGQALVPLGLGDDQASFGYLTALNTWETRLFDAIVGLRGFFAAAQDFNNAVISIKTLSPDTANPIHPLLQVAENKRLTDPSWFQDIRLISLESQDGTPLDYELGDCLAIHYKNEKSLVSRAVGLFEKDGYEADSVVNIICSGVCRSSRIKDFTGSLQTLFSEVLDVGGIPKRSFFSHLARFAKSEEEQQKLLEISSPAGTDLFFDYCLREKRNYIDVVEDFRSLSLPLTEFLKLVPLIIPRQYSIASSPNLVASKADLCVAIAEAKTPLGRHRVGLCSGYLKSLQPGELVRAYVAKGSISQCAMKGHLIQRRPLICIGPGTGIAPIRAIMQFYVDSSRCGDNNSSALFVFNGCRRRNRDNLFAEEWRKEEILVEDGVLHEKGANAVIAYSQEGMIKEYVTHKIKQHGEAVWKLLSEGASVFISGSAKRMPQDVKKAIAAICCSHGNMTTEAAEDFIQNKIRKKEYLVEAWS